MAFEKDMNKAQERARKVKLFGHDIHGTLTTNNVIVDIEGNRRYGSWMALETFRLQQTI